MKSITEQFEVESTMQGERIAMEIDTESTVHLMGLLTDLYKDRLQALIREYTTNAWDAHIEAGVNLPIEVTLPSHLSPSFIVRDYGPGLNVEDIRTIYSKYGASSKRNTDDQAGMLGLGCKSALTYTSQFTVTSVKDGTQLIVLVARDEHGAGTMQVLDETKTDAANGTEITVAIRREDHYRCRELAETFFSYWKKGTVLLNGVEPHSITESALKISDSLYLVEGASESIVVMGQVPYPHEIDLNIPYSYQHATPKLVAFVPIGAVRPTPSREGLMDTKNTKHATEQIIADFNSQIDRAIQSAVDAATTPQAAIEALTSWERYSAPRNDSTAFTYKGVPIPSDFSLPDHLDPQGRTVATRMMQVEYRETYSKTDYNLRNSIPVAQWPKTVWVYGYAPEKFTAIHKNKLRYWASQNGICEQFVLLRGAAPVSDFIDTARVVSWDTIKAIKLQPNTNGYYPDKQIPGSYKAYTENGYVKELAGSSIRQDKPIFYGHGNEHFFSSYNAGLKMFYSEYTLVCLQQNRVAKFERDVPKVIAYETALQTGFAKWQATVDKRDLIALEMRAQDITRYYSKLNAKRIDDPELVKLIEISKRDLFKLTDLRRKFGRIVDTSTLNVEVEDVLAQRYPLYDRWQADHEHTYLYLNMIYAKNQT